MTREVEKHRRKLYGRRKGPKLSAHQEQLLKTLLPQFALDLESDRDPRTYFPGPVDDVWLEIGFGAGEHLLWQIDHHPHVGLIGAEPYVSGTAKLLSKLRTPTVALHAPPPPQTLEEKIDHAPLSSSTRGGGAGEVGRGEIAKHIRLYSGDARDIIEALPTATLGRVFILFPDPWPKTRHHKRRFIQTDTLGALARTMKAGAELRFASDDADYLNWTLERLAAHSAFEWTATRAQDWQTRPDDWPQTRYEAKALHGVPAFLRFVKC